MKPTRGWEGGMGSAPWSEYVAKKKKIKQKSVPEKEGMDENRRQNVGE